MAGLFKNFAEAVNYMYRNIPVDSPFIGKANVKAYNIYPNTITAAEIAPNAIGSSELADDAVDTAAIQNLAVTTAKIANQNVTAPKIFVPQLVDATGAAKALTTGVLTVYNTFASATHDPLGWFDSGQPTKAFTIVGTAFPGTYRVTVVWEFAANTTGERQVIMTANTAGVVADYRPTNGTSGNSAGSLSKDFRITTDVAFGVSALQNSGGNLNFTPKMSFEYVSS